MHTQIRLADGILMTSFVADELEEDIEISQRRWRTAIKPAVMLLQATGGGIMYVVHDPEDLAPE